MIYCENRENRFCKGGERMRKRTCAAILVAVSGGIAAVVMAKRCNVTKTTKKGCQLTVMS